MNLIRTSILALLMAGAVHAQAPNDAPRAERTPTEDEQLSLAALEGLMTQPPERALPILKKVMAGPQSTVVKRRALFVLSQVDSPEARDILLQTARSTNAELQGEAIRAIGIGGNPQALDALQEIYNTGALAVQRDILQAWMIAGRKEAVYQAAINAKTEDESSEAIRMLDVMGATEELRKLSDRPDTPRGLLDALAIGGDLAGLRKIVDGTGDRSMRVEAVQRIGIIQTDAARAALREIYSTSTDARIKEAALHGMLIAQDEEGVLDLYRVAKSTDEKRSLLRMLTMMGGDAALKAIDAQLEKTP